MSLTTVCGVCSTDYESAAHLPYTADTLFAKMQAAGFAAVQFAFSSIAETAFTPSGQLEIPAAIPVSAVNAADRAAAKYGLPLRVINGTFNMAHPDAEVRREGIRRFAILLDAADALGVKFISLCSGSRNAEHLWSPSPENDSPEAWAAMYDTICRAVELAEAHGITLAIESEASNIISSPERARRIMDAVGSDKLKMILDCANLFHAGRAHPEFVRETLDAAFEAYGYDIVIAHGKDIREGDGIEFCGTGRGIVDFTYTAKLLEKWNFTGGMFLHGIYDESDMIRAREYWEAAVRA